MPRKKKAPVVKEPKNIKKEIMQNLFDTSVIELAENGYIKQNTYALIEPNMVVPLNVKPLLGFSLEEILEKEGSKMKIRFNQRSSARKSFRGFDTSMHDLKPEMFWNDFLVFEIHYVDSDDKEEGGYALYTKDEWNTGTSADWEADRDGDVMFMGEYTGDRIPKSILENALS